MCDLGQEGQLQNQPSSCSSRVDSWHLVISEGRLEKLAFGHLARVDGVPSQSGRDDEVTPLPCHVPAVTSRQIPWPWRVPVCDREAGLALALDKMECFGKFD